MVQELRRITLDKEEVIIALEAHRRMVPNFLPAGDIIDFKPESDSSITVTIEGAGPDAKLYISDARLQAPLIRFCIENNIMLPRNGRKSALVTGDKISLCVSLDIDTYIVGAMEPIRLVMAAAAC